MNLTPYHAQYFAHELSKRIASDGVEKLAATLSSAQVDLNPHQVEAALFAFRSPLSKGAILADEVGLGKTIEAGLVISQKWAERKRKILIVTPANLRKQWSQELQEKFFLPSIILEAKSFNAAIAARNLNPFDQADIVICSYQFIKTKAPYVRSIAWDLAVIDEAHRLRNVYKTGNKISKAIKDALIDAPKILLTATPLQNSLLELYGLVSIIDDYAFGDLKSFRSQYARVNSNADPEQFLELKERLKPICKRTLRRQVLEYIRYTNRIALVQEFYPSEDEQRLYEWVSDYLQSPNLYALPASQRQLMTLILRKLLASSTYAISGTLAGLAKKLENTLLEHARQSALDGAGIEGEIADNFETYDELADEFEEGEDDEEERLELTPEDRRLMQSEIGLLKEFAALAESIKKNSKGEKLTAALERGFAELERLKAAKKAIIFTESKRTQEYLKELLQSRGYGGKIVLFNGTNTDADSQAIYRAWVNRYKDTDKVTSSKTADMRAALVDYFREEATIMIATEAAAEGINLQFCSLLINYDMPWNPQRIEQRIGRCHRYGQKFDVVVVNFLNKANAADERVYELLNDKFKLFDGVFGASDEVLGSIESGVDFEKRIAQIYQNCRTTDQIAQAFNELQVELETSISTTLKHTRQQLLENFDEEVHEKLKINLRESQACLSKYEGWLWQLTKQTLGQAATFDDGQHAFVLQQSPSALVKAPLGRYQMGKQSATAHVYHLAHPLAQNIIEHAKSLRLGVSRLSFDYTHSGKKIGILEGMVGQSGWIMLNCLTVSSFDSEDHLLVSVALDRQGTPDMLAHELAEDVTARLFSLSAQAEPLSSDALPSAIADGLNASIAMQRQARLAAIEARNGVFFEQEMEKLDHWGEDRRNSLKLNLKDLEEQIKELKKQARNAGSLPEKLKIEKARKKCESDRDQAWREYEEAAREIERAKDRLMAEVEARLDQTCHQQEVFVIRFSVR